MRFILALLLLISGVTYADGPYTRSRVLGGSSGSGASATPGGVSGSVQYNANGAFGGSPLFTFDTTRVTISTLLSVSGTANDATALISGINANDAVLFMTEGGVTSGGSRMVYDGGDNHWRLETGNSGFTPRITVPRDGGVGIAGIVPNTSLDVSGTVSSTFARLSSSTTACAAAANIGDMVRVPSRNTIGICIAALSVAPLVTTTAISPSAL